MVRELPDPLNVKDVEGRFIAANPATARLMRAGSADRLIGRSDHDFYPPELARSFRQDEISMLEAGEPRRSDQPAVLPDGSSGWLSTLKAPLRDQSGRLVGIITHNRDISEQMRHAQIKNEFISTVSHELRTPLTSIRGSLGLIAAGVAGELPPKAANLVKIAHSNSERLVHLINDILDMEKIESGKMTFEPQILLLRPIIEQAISGAANYLADKKVRIVIIDDTRRARVAVDPARMHQVLANLLSNAIKFSPPEGIVTVRLTRANGKVRIGVEDTGPGIPEAFRHRIFGKFEQADASSTRQVGGTGLGLSISKAIIDRMGGEISFETEVGQGTKFHVDLAEAEAAVAQAPVPQDARHGVLICASDADISTTLGALLDAEDLASDTAPDIESAKALLRTRTYAAVLLDIEIAGDSGMQFFRDIRSGAGMPDIPVIILSARLDQARQTLLGAAVGLVDWLEKPVDPLRLHAVLETIFARVNGHKPAILHVEDDPGVLEVMSHGLGSEVTMTPARTLAEARAALDARTYAVVILDITLPDGSGLELLPEIPARTPVIVFSAAEADQRLGDGVKAAFTKTKASEIDVAALVRSFVVAKT
jgi:PAS domain S-box-containing protein